ncbi:DUF4270 family protein [Flavobacterium restrictum]|uniref:DUF4270 domain-containing protein n=1 Tax=Flavobacterium restrictum TaxID=2594428 RepID=A0A553EBG0_9FLAO|nr:DUF4270 family protein [Flavobacterium restrictum]TRX42370.1 DUF4270 domain-containing protein [Flavobacterium restrictum]
MFKGVVVLFFGMLICSCNSDGDAGEFVVGSDYLSVTNKVLLIDTMAVDMATINFDSLVTSSQNRILIGNYDDPIFGKVKSESYFQLTPTSYRLYNDNSDTDAPNYVFDSIKMVLKQSHYYYGDTTKVQTFSIHQLTQKVKPSGENNTSFFNNSTLTYNPEVLGSVSFKPRPNGKDSIAVTLSPDFGEALFQKLKQHQIANYDEFTQYLKGFVIKSTSANSANVIGFNLTSALRLYYSKYQDESDVSLIKNFTILDASKQFNNITLDKKGTIIENLPVSSSKLSSTLTGNKAYIQSGTGIACRVDFPNIKQLKYIATKGTIVDAELVIKPVNNSYSEAYPLVDSLKVYVADKLNRIKGTLNTSTGTPIYAILNKQSDEFNENIGYSISVGAFLQSEMVKQTDAKYSLILTLPSINKAVDRIVLGDQKNADNKIKLKIYYITY